MTAKQKPIRPIFESELYKVVKKGGSYVVTLLSSDVVQFSGLKSYCIDWARSNSPEFVGEFE